MPAMTPIDSGSLTVRVSTAAYSIGALEKAAYRLADRSTVVFRDHADGHITLEFIAVADGGKKLNEAVQTFFREALDYELRQRIEAETGPLRNLILAHAFSRTRLAGPSSA